MGIRLVIVDDNPHVRWNGRVHPANATFQHFVAGSLDLPGGSVASITSCVPLRDVDQAPDTRPLDERVRVVGTAPFEGIAGFLRHAPSLARHNRPLLKAALAQADLAWIKVPASNAGLASALAVRAGVPRFVWVAGSAREVAGARFGGPRLIGAAAIGALYDLVGRASAIGGDRVVVGREIVASLVEPSELRPPAERRRPADPGVVRLVWAGRLVEGKGLETLFDEISALGRERGDRRIELTLIGEGPARAALERRAAAGGISDRITWRGYLADRAPYLDALADADAFVFPSRAEGFPKAVLDAMAVGLPVVARPVGSLAPLAWRWLVPLDRLASALAELDDARSPVSWTAAARASREYAAEHTRPAELERIVARWRERWPDLPW
jgi:glycosyltransferase involved in cell wall biosynthesis